jgi:hypothetical protein
VARDVVLDQAESDFGGVDGADLDDDGDRVAADRAGVPPMTQRGFPGEPGHPGEQGEAGRQGEAGVAGRQGEAGVHGPRGDAGAVGAAGSQGDIGKTGATGARGLQGLQPKLRWAPVVGYLLLVAAVIALWMRCGCV